MAIEQIERLPDVSFIDDDINLDGIQKQMLQDYQDKYMEETGEETVLDRGEPIALILYACSVQIYQMYMYVDRAGKQNLLKYAFGAFLDNLAALKGIERTAAKPATVTMRFTLSEAQTGAIAIRPEPESRMARHTSRPMSMRRLKQERPQSTWPALPSRPA